MMVSGAARAIGNAALRRYGMEADITNKCFGSKYPRTTAYVAITGALGVGAGMIEGVEAGGELEPRNPSLSFGAVAVHGTLGLIKGPFLPLYYIYEKAMHLQNNC